MPKRTVPAAKFKPGHRVIISLSGKEAVISEEPRWNGGTYMYRFENEEVSCGEMYLSLAERKNPNDSITTNNNAMNSETLSQYISNLPRQDLIKAYNDCEKWSDAGVLPKDAFLRQVIKEYGLDDNVLTISLVASYVYRYFAQEYFKLDSL